MLYLRFWIKRNGDTLSYFLFGLGDELNKVLLKFYSGNVLRKLTDVNNTCNAYSPTVFSSSL